MELSPDGTRLYVANSVDNTVSVIDTTTGTTVGPPIPVGTGPMAVAVSRDGARVYVVGLGDGSADQPTLPLQPTDDTCFS